MVFNNTGGSAYNITGALQSVGGRFGKHSEPCEQIEGRSTYTLRHRRNTDHKQEMERTMEVNVCFASRKRVGWLRAR